MRSKGFTLVELLAVLIILGIVTTMVVISVGSIITNSEHSLSGIQKGKIEEAAKEWYTKEGDMTKNSSCINLQTLISKGYLEGNSVTDPETGLVMAGSVNVLYSNNQYSYEYVDTACSLATCTFTDADSDSDYSLGDGVNCGGEEFYIISSDTNTVTMIAKKNIEVTTNTPKQSLSASTERFSSNAYWWDNLNSNYKSQYPSTAQQTSDIRNVYDSNSYIKMYLDAYESYLSKLGFQATSRLLKIEDSITVCGVDVLTNGTCSNPSILVDGVQDYWSGAAYKSGVNTGIIYVNHTTGLGYASHSSYYGIRPVVQISKSHIPLS